MEERFVAEPAVPAPDLDPGAIESTSTVYLGRWNRLVSTTNWEKGRIISEWRAALIEVGAPPSSCTDEAWCRRVGGLTPQHAGRLRRVYQRFAEVRDQYAGLYWSHFQAALDWDDAEMWLEGAVQNGWSIADMQHERTKTLGALEEPPGEAAAGTGEDVPPPEAISGSVAEVHPADEPAEERTGRPAPEPDDVGADAAPDVAGSYGEATPSPVRPFENLPPLPADLHEAFEAFKLAIVHHRIAGWQETSCDDVLAALDALRQLALAPFDTVDPSP